MCKSATTEAFSFPRYLLAKQSVDDRALNKDVLAVLRSRLNGLQSLRVSEVGAGIGSMAVRLLRWQVLPPDTEYTLIDSLPENIAFARRWLPEWALANGWQTQVTAAERISLSRPERRVDLHLVQADVFDYLRRQPAAADLLIAHAFLDLLPLPEGLREMFSLLRPGGRAWLTLNFDGLTTLEPPFDAALDERLERLYHRSMDERPGGGDSRSGRHLFRYLQQVGGQIEAAGASDWVVYPQDGRYPADEAYFLGCILHFFEQSLGAHPEVDREIFARWLAARRRQVEQGELVYLAHQMDFLVQKE